MVRTAVFRTSYRLDIKCASFFWEWGVFLMCGRTCLSAILSLLESAQCFVLPVWEAIRKPFLLSAQVFPLPSDQKTFFQQGNHRPVCIFSVFNNTSQCYSPYLSCNILASISFRVVGQGLNIDFMYSVSLMIWSTFDRTYAIENAGSAGYKCLSANSE